MEFLWVGVAFLFGLISKQLSLPPLVGYLAAGFGLHAVGLESNAAIEMLSDIGVALLLFTIGLKINVNSLYKREIWAGTSAHMLLVIGLTVVISLLLGIVGLHYFTGLSAFSSAILGIAVSFSSTVCAVKILEERGEMRTRHGQLTLGVLIFQDIVAVVFLTLATDLSPSWWALSLLLLPLTRPLWIKLIEQCGHGELLPLVGFFLVTVVGELFVVVGLKAHLGALVIGVLLSGCTKSAELAKSLLSFKDIFLIGFFLSIGFTALPTVEMLGAALIMSIALPFKAVLFFLCLTLLQLRSRTAFLSSLALSNYSEFGLIVCAASVELGYLEKEWLVILALSVALSYVFSSIANLWSHQFYRRFKSGLSRFERKERLAEDQFSQIGDASILIVGMGRVGSSACDALGAMNKRVCGIDADAKRVARHRELGREVIVADAEDPDYWEQLKMDHVELVMIAMPNCTDILEVAKRLKEIKYPGKIASIARYEDERALLTKAGIDMVFNFYQDAGIGFADESVGLVGK